MKLNGLILIVSILFMNSFVNSKKKIVCYWSSLSTYRGGSGRHSIEKINPNLCTHLIYAHIGINSKGILTNLNPSGPNSSDIYNEFVNLKQKNANLKVLLSVGGPSQEPIIFSEISRSRESRAKFIISSLNFLIKYNFDGLDIDWQYPTFLGGSLKDRDNFNLLLRELKQKFSMNKNKFILSAAISGDLKTIKDIYSIQLLCKNVNFINLKTFDMHYKNVTSFQAPLRKIQGDPKERNHIKQVVNHFRDNGCQLKKIMLGIPTYGRTYTLKNLDENKIGDLVNGPGPKGPYTQLDGYLGYNELCLYQRRQFGWKYQISKWKAQIYAWRHKLWLSYDTPMTVKIKIKYIQRKELGGVMFYSIDTDDFDGICSQVKYPLLRAAKKELKQKKFFN